MRGVPRDVGGWTVRRLVAATARVFRACGQANRRVEAYEVGLGILLYVGGRTGLIRYGIIVSGDGAVCSASVSVVGGAPARKPHNGPP